MSTLYMKNSKGEYYPVSFQKVMSSDWEKKIIIVRIGTDEHPAEDKDIDEMYDSLKNADALDDLEDTSFLVTTYEIGFDVLGSAKEIENKCVAVRVEAGDDMSKLGVLQKKAKEQLRGKTKKVIVMPAPLTVKEYKEVIDIKRRCDTRRNRRGR